MTRSNRLLICTAVLCFVAFLARGEEVVNKGFEGMKDGPGKFVEIPGHGRTWEVMNDSVEKSAIRSVPLPVGQIRGSQILVDADISAAQVSAKPLMWNGIKLMAHIEFPGGEEWPQADIPVGTFDWWHVFARFQIPENATAVTLILGLEKVTGTARFSNLTVALSNRFVQALPVENGKPIFKGHDLPRLRGAMVHPNITEADLENFTEKWNGNLIRWQLVRSSVDKVESDFSSYDKWLDGMLEKTDRVAVWAQKRGIKVVLDLHSPPGGKFLEGGYVGANGGLFTDPKAQEHFVEVWKKMARRYKGNNTFWGFDLVNEPVDDGAAPGCMNWQELALAAGKAVREIDPERTLIIEPPKWGGAPGFKFFNPVPLERVVYSFHMYEPIRFTHQKVFHHDESAVAYPGEIDKVVWNREALVKAMQPAIDFASRYRVHFYVGEFSAIRWAPGAEKYLADVTSIFEEHGWDWSYHAYREWPGWSLEYGTDEKDTKPAENPTARFEVMERLWRENKKAAP